MTTPKEKVEKKVEPKASSTSPKVQVKPVEEVVDRTEEKTERFRRVAKLRANFVIDKLANLGKITENPQNYNFTEEQIEGIFLNIETLTADIKRKFLDCISMTEHKEKYKVEL